MNKPRVLIIAGPNGAGKSTMAPDLLLDLGIPEFVNADTIAQGLSTGRGSSGEIGAGRLMLRRLKELAGQQVDFGFETTLSAKSFAPWLGTLKHEQGYRIQLVFCWLSNPQIARDRVAFRVSRGGHSIPDDVIERRFHAGLENFFSIYMPLADDWRLIEAGPFGVVSEIAKSDESNQVKVKQPRIWQNLEHKYGRQDR